MKGLEEKDSTGVSLRVEKGCGIWGLLSGSLGGLRKRSLGQVRGGQAARCLSRSEP